MKLTQNNKIGYLQVIISFAIIISFCAMPCFDFHEGDQSFGIIGIDYFIDVLKMSKDTYYKGRLLEMFLLVVIFMQLVNIFIQAKKKNVVLPIISGGVILFCSILGFAFAQDEIKEIKDSEIEVDYLLGFYIATISILAQILVPIFAAIFCKDGSHETAAGAAMTDNTGSAQMPQNEKKLLENEVKQLKARLSQIEKEKIERRKELEIAEKENAEKENLKNEIAKLKEAIKNHENNPEQL